MIIQRYGYVYEYRRQSRNIDTNKKYIQNANKNGINPYRLFTTLNAENTRMGGGGLARPLGGGVN